MGCAVGRFGASTDAQVESHVRAFHHVIRQVPNIEARETITTSSFGFRPTSTLPVRSPRAHIPVRPRSATSTRNQRPGSPSPKTGRVLTLKPQPCCQPGSRSSRHRGSRASPLGARAHARVLQPCHRAGLPYQPDGAGGSCCPKRRRRSCAQGVSEMDAGRGGGTNAEERGGALRRDERFVEAAREGSTMISTFIGRSGDWSAGVMGR